MGGRARPANHRSTRDGEGLHRQAAQRLEGLRRRDPGAEVRAAVGEAEEDVRLEARIAIGTAIPEERQLALRCSADTRLLPAVEARAEAVAIVHLAARADAIVVGVLELDV